MTAILRFPNGTPVQLTLNLLAPSARRCRAEERHPFWDYIDGADLGGELHARRPGVKALLTAERRADGSWIGYHDLVLGAGGSSGPTRPQITRDDALVSAAYPVAKHCEAVLAQNGTAPRIDATVARQLLRWLRQLDVL
jgi:hypothetical protein